MPDAEATLTLRNALCNSASVKSRLRSSFHRSAGRELSYERLFSTQGLLRVSIVRRIISVLLAWRHVFQSIMYFP